MEREKQRRLERERKAKEAEEARLKAEREAAEAEAALEAEKQKAEEEGRVFVKPPRKSRFDVSPHWPCYLLAVMTASFISLAGFR